MKPRRPLVLAFATALLVAAVVAPAAMSRTGGAAAAPTLQVKSSRFGNVLFDGRDFVLYAFTRDPRGGKSRCYGNCATAWPPYVVRGKLSAGKGVKRSLLGTVRRNDGKLQVTFDGRPLYYYVHDDQPGDILCQGVAEFGGVWLIVRPTGKLVR
jgi:predicted lipoprotein with Yx(FWY)xxD motif